MRARRPSLIYRASRYARRHRLALAAAAIVVASLVGYTVLSVQQQAREMEQAVARERQEAAEAREVADFVVGLFEASDPNVLQNRDSPVTRMVDQGLQARRSPVARSRCCRPAC